MSKSQPLSTTPNVTVFGDGGSESFQVGAHVEMGGGVHPERAWKLCNLSAYLALCISST